MCGIFCCVEYERHKFVPAHGLILDLEKRGPDCLNQCKILLERCALLLIGSVLSIRGENIVPQPAVSSNGNILCFNGEIFRGIKLKLNDTDYLVNELDRSDDISCLLQTIVGPFSFVFWHNTRNELWFGKDRFGRRSLLVKFSDTQLIISSILPRDDVDPQGYRELCPGLYKINFNTPTQNLPEIKHIPYPDPMMVEMPRWEVPIIPFIIHDLMTNDIPHQVFTNFANLLHESVRLRVVNSTPYNCKNCKTHHLPHSSYTTPDPRIPLNYDNAACEHPKVGVLFSGGLDSMVISFLLDKILDPKESIDLLNVAFHEKDLTNQEFPPKCPIKDRENALAGVGTLANLNPNRTWNFIQIDVSRETLEKAVESEIKYLIAPGHDAILDKSIGPALWFAASGRGQLSSYSKGNVSRLGEYDSSAQVLFSGFGADELLAGYSKHRKEFGLGRIKELETMLREDIKSVYLVNLGRDDRIISSHGKEARFPFLDEDFVDYVRLLPLAHKANLNLPPGVGDKMLLRLVAKAWGLEQASVLIKKAIQFGSNIAKLYKIPKSQRIVAQ